MTTLAAVWAWLCIPWRWLRSERYTYRLVVTDANGTEWVIKTQAEWDTYMELILENRRRPRLGPWFSRKYQGRLGPDDVLCTVRAEPPEES